MKWVKILWLLGEKKKKLREKGGWKVPLSSLAPSENTWKSQQLFPRSYVHSYISKLLEFN